MGVLKSLPLFVIGPAILAVLVTLSIVSLNWFRRHQLPLLRFGHGDSDFNAAMLASIMVFYGLAAALTAVHVWEVYEKVEQITRHEATSLAVLYRNVSGYPEPVRSVLREDLRAYTDQVIREAWPQQRRGIIPEGGVQYMDKFQTDLYGFQPKTDAQRILAFETVASYSRMMEARRMRVDSVERHLPGVMWVVIVLGAAISIVSSFFFTVLDARVHRIQVALLAAFIGLVIFIILVLDYPYRGDTGLPSTPYQIVYEQLLDH